MSGLHRFALRVYYEDTDLAGIVYYANYLKFIERARSEFVRTIGIDQVRLRDEEDQVFAVRHMVCDYIAPAHFDDELEVTTEISQATPARIVMRQIVTRDAAVLFTADVTLVCLSRAGRPRRLPAKLRQSLPSVSGT